MDTIAGYNPELEEKIERQARAYRSMERRQPIAQLVEAEDIKILGQDGGMLLIQLELLINKVPYTFIGPMQVINNHEQKPQYDIQTIKLPDHPDYEGY